MAEEKNFGTEADGSRSTEYCTYCYQDGRFTSPEATVEEMIEMSAKAWADADPSVTYERALADCGKTIPQLKRWKK